MVVSRRNPAAPPPVTSRTNSAQALPRKQKSAQAPSPLLDEKPKPQSRPRRPKPRGKQRPRPLSVLDRLFLLSLFSFVAYAATVCLPSSPWHKDPMLPHHEQSIVCRTLITYRTVILEPYVLTPLKATYEHTLGHRIVKAQYVTHVQPHLGTIKARAQPAVDAALQLNNRLIQPTITFVYGQLWKSNVLPWYYRAYLPRYRMYVAPRLQAGWKYGVEAPLKPYTDLVRTYARDYQVYVHTHVIHKAKAWYYETVYPTYAIVQPKVVQIYNTVEPTLCTAYRQAQNAVEVVWTHAKPYLCKAWKETRVYLGVALTEGAKARRTYVDPHVRKILERVRVSGDGSSSVTASATAVGGDEQVDGTIFEEDSTPTYESILEPTLTQLSEENVVDIPVTPLPASEEVVTPPRARPSEGVMDELEEVTAAATPTPVDEDVAEQVVDVFVRSTKELEQERIAAEEAGSITASALSSETTTTTVVEEPTPKPSVVAEDEDDLEDFLMELGVDSLYSAVNPGDSTVDEARVEFQSSEPEISEEELLAAKKAETAEKRAKIIARHVAWQLKVNDLVEEQLGRVVERIEGVRLEGVNELGVEYKDGKNAEKAEAEQGLGKKAMDSVEKQGRRLVKGLGMYLGKAIVLSGNWKVTSPTDPGATEKAKKAKGENDKWDEVTSKADERFGAVVRSAQAEVHEWYNGMKGREVEVALEVAQAVKRLAETAQADLAMDYAWLDDVTFQDWQTYHDLMRTYERFEQTALAIQNGTYVPDHTKECATLSSPDPLVKALDKLESELDDIVLGFKLALGGLNRRASKVFSGRVYRDYDGENRDDDEPSEGFFAVKREKGELVDDMREMPGYGASGEEKPTVSILPIAPTQDDDWERVRDAGSILIGKDAKQVEEAVERASALGEGVRVGKSEEEL